MKMKTVILVTVCAFVLALLSACGQEAPTEHKIRQAVAIEESDQCHLCGMIISQFPGPKAELASKGEHQVNKFCSNRDMFSYYLQPENKHRALQIFVHDMTEVPWDSPSDDHFIKAQDAWYVYGSNMKAAMGPALASFGKKESAEMFAKMHGGDLLKFEDITLELLGSGMSLSMNNTEPSSEEESMEHHHH